MLLVRSQGVLVQGGLGTSGGRRFPSSLERLKHDQNAVEHPRHDLKRSEKTSGASVSSARRWQGNLLDELDAGAKDFAAYFRLRKSSKTDLTAFEQSCYGQAVEKQMEAVLKNEGKKGKDDLVLAELQALQALPC